MGVLSCVVFVGIPWFFRLWPASSLFTFLFFLRKLFFRPHYHWLPFILNLANCPFGKSMSIYLAYDFFLNLCFFLLVKTFVNVSRMTYRFSSAIFSIVEHFASEKFGFRGRFKDKVFTICTSDIISLTSSTFKHV